MTTKHKELTALSAVLAWRRAYCLSALIKDKYCLGTCMMAFILVSFCVNIRFYLSSLKTIQGDGFFSFFYEMELNLARNEQQTESLHRMGSCTGPECKV